MSSEVNFTKGPWLHRGKSDSVHKSSSTHPFGELIFRFDEDASPSDEDLALILAAPDLFQALVAWQMADQHQHDYGHLEEATDDIAQAWETAVELRDAAIAAATSAA
jgi:hypothetical protein